MNRRLVIIDPNETPIHAGYWGVGLGNEIYLTTDLEKLKPDQLKQALTLGPGDAALLVGGGGFKFFEEKSGLHFGIRGENWFDCVKLDRLSVEGGSYVKVIDDFPSQDIINLFMSPEFTADVDFG